MRKVKMPKVVRPPRLPSLLDRKIYKTGQTRGADDDVIYQNRVSRSSTVLVPYALWDQTSPPNDDETFDSGFIALISALHYFGNAEINQELVERGLALGENALVFYQTRPEWLANNPETLGWTAAQARRNPLGGQYVARVSATTAVDNGGKIIRGFDTTNSKGAGIRLYEYASAEVILQCRSQLEALFWLCSDAYVVAVENGMTDETTTLRAAHIFNICENQGLMDMDALRTARIINANEHTVCPLCLEELSGQGFFNRLAQAEGREVHDLTVTQINLFHITELQYGSYNHRPYNLGWGHHHCNVVVKDAGITDTLVWMNSVLQRNVNEGHFTRN